MRGRGVQLALHSHLEFLNNLLTTPGNNCTKNGTFSALPQNLVLIIFTMGPGAMRVSSAGIRHRCLRVVVEGALHR